MENCIQCQLNYVIKVNVISNRIWTCFYVREYIEMFFDVLVVLELGVT
jgi:hypothetical protein